jgi:chorismate synthase
MLDFVTAGESHGPCLTCLVTGFPAGVPVDPAGIDAELSRRQSGYGRGGRMAIERDRVQVLSGVRRGRSIGSPVTLVIANRDNTLDEKPALTRPRPGHADLAGGVKYLTRDLRDVLERASARETAARVAAGALVRPLLAEFGVTVFGHVVAVGGVRSTAAFAPDRAARDASEMLCLDPAATAQMKVRVDQARAAGDSLGGVVEVQVLGAPMGLGAYDQWHRRLDARLAGAVMGIQAIKGVEIGLGFAAADRPGSQVHDEIVFEAGARERPTLGFVRPTNNAGGIEGGISNGQPIVLRAAMKPIPTLVKPLRSVDLTTRQPADAAAERADVCAVPAAGVVAENVVAFEIARAMVEKFGGDSLAEMRANYEGFLRAAREL